MFNISLVVKSYTSGAEGQAQGRLFLGLRVTVGRMVNQSRNGCFWKRLIESRSDGALALVLFFSPRIFCQQVV